jgi:hypothetical protein
MTEFIAWLHHVVPTSRPLITAFAEFCSIVGFGFSFYAVFALVSIRRRFVARGLASELIPVFSGISARLTAHANTASLNTGVADEDVRMLFTELDAKLSTVIKHYSRDVKGKSKNLRKFLKKKSDRSKHATISSTDMLDCRLEVAYIITHLETFIFEDGWSK